MLSVPMDVGGKIERKEWELKDAMEEFVEQDGEERTSGAKK